MSTTALARRYTPEELLALADDMRYELVNGELVERHIGFDGGWITWRLLALLTPFCGPRKLGWLLTSDVSYQCFPDDPNRIRSPDLSFIAFGRFSFANRPRGHVPVVPDFVVEVVSPNDSFQKVQTKVREYLDAGVRLIWVADPGAQSVHVFRPGQRGVVLWSQDELTGEDVLSGFRCQVADLFQPPEGAEES